MKKALKICGITLLSILALVIIVVGVALYLVLTPSKLTNLVRQYAPDFVTCEVALDQAEVTLFKTFPNVGVEIDNVMLINPMEGAKTDTLAQIENLTVSLDVWKLLTKSDVLVKECILENADVNIFTDAKGASNYDIFPTDTTTVDTTESSSSMGMIDLDLVRLKNVRLTYEDKSMRMLGVIEGLNMDLRGNLNDEKMIADLKLDTRSLQLDMPDLNARMKTLDMAFDGNVDEFNLIDGTLQLRSPNVNLAMGDEYLKNDTIDLNLPLQFDLSALTATLHEAKIGLNDFLFTLTGEVAMQENDDIEMDIDVKTGTLVIGDVLAFLPDSMRYELFQGIDFTGNIALQGKVAGVYNANTMPVMKFDVVADHATMSMPDPKLDLTDIAMEAFLNLDMNDSSNMEVKQLEARLNNTTLSFTGDLKDLTGNIFFDGDLTADLYFVDIQSFMPDGVVLKGNTTAGIAVNCSLDDLFAAMDDYNFDHINASGSLVMRDLDIISDDTTRIQSPNLSLRFAVPSPQRNLGYKGVFYASVKAPELHAVMGKAINANLEGVNIDLSSSNVLETNVMPSISADFAFTNIDVKYDTISFQTQNPNSRAELRPAKNDPQGVAANLKYASDNLMATLGKDYSLTISSLELDGNANQDETKRDLLNKWNPIASLKVKEAEMQMPDVTMRLAVPEIDFNINKEKINVNKSDVIIGESDLSLTGEITGLEDWLQDQGLLTGRMALTSDYLNINQLMELVSGMGVAEDTTEMQTVSIDTSMINQEDNPFMVPQGVDFVFDVNLAKALYGDTDLNTLGGHITVKDGILVLEQVGFTSKAAEMQLTALYKSPRKNHLFLGMDFHLIDVQINDLLHMIPEIDTLVPMLKSFDGQAEFHIAAETALKSNYEPKISTLRASADIEGQNLFVSDTSSFTKITNLLKVSSEGKFMIDSLDVQMTVFRNEIDLYPCLISVGKYQVVASGRHNLDMSFDYHLSVTKTPLPVRLGLNVKGTLDNLQYSIVPCQYKNLYRPNKRKDVDNQVLELKKMIAESVKSTVKH